MRSLVRAQPGEFLPMVSFQCFSRSRPSGSPIQNERAPEPDQSGRSVYSTCRPSPILCCFVRVCVRESLSHRGRGDTRKARIPYSLRYSYFALLASPNCISTLCCPWQASPYMPLIGHVCYSRAFQIYKARKGSTHAAFYSSQPLTSCQGGALPRNPESLLGHSIAFTRAQHSPCAAAPRCKDAAFP